MATQKDSWEAFADQQGLPNIQAFLDFQPAQGSTNTQVQPTNRVTPSTLRQGAPVVPLTAEQLRRGTAIDSLLANSPVSADVTGGVYNPNQVILANNSLGGQQRGMMPQAQTTQRFMAQLAAASTPDSMKRINRAINA